MDTHTHIHMYTHTHIHTHTHRHALSKHRQCLTLLCSLVRSFLESQSCSHLRIFINESAHAYIEWKSSSNSNNNKNNNTINNNNNTMQEHIAHHTVHTQQHGQQPWSGVAVVAGSACSRASVTVIVIHTAPAYWMNAANWFL